MMSQIYTVIVLVCVVQECIAIGAWISSCGGVVIATTSTDYITPWNGSQQNYDPSLICQWKIKTRSDSTLKLKLTQLDLTSTASVRNCSSQPTLEVISEDNLNLKRSLAEPLCGTSAQVLYLNTPNEIFFRFSPNGQPTGSGFRLEFHSEPLPVTCSEITDEAHVRAAPFFTNQSCWLIYSQKYRNDITGYNCTLGGGWSTTEENVSCIYEDGLSSDDEIGDYEAPPHTVTVVAWCYPGFGNLSLKALGNCSLRDFIYSTTYISCGLPPAVPNANINSTSGSIYINTVVYDCLEGYHLTSGSNFAECKTDAQFEVVKWTDPPVCHKIGCDDPPPVSNSTVSINGTSYGDTATYTCHTGFNMSQGSQTITCQTNDTWSTPPLCSKINCGPPPSVSNSTVTSSGTYYKDVAHYTCNSGYSTSSPSGSINCLHDGTWSAPPQCNEDKASSISLAVILLAACVPTAMIMTAVVIATYVRYRCRRDKWRNSATNPQSKKSIEFGASIQRTDSVESDEYYLPVTADDDLVFPALRSHSTRTGALPCIPSEVGAEYEFEYSYPYTRSLFSKSSGYGETDHLSKQGTKTFSPSDRNITDEYDDANDADGYYGSRVSQPSQSAEEDVTNTDNQLVVDEYLQPVSIKALSSQYVGPVVVCTDDLLMSGSRKSSSSGTNQISQPESQSSQINKSESRAIDKTNSVHDCYSYLGPAEDENVKYREKDYIECY